MYLWEFNNYILGYNEKLLRDQEYLITVAYQTAAFNNSKHKPKKLDYYIQKLRNKIKGKNNDVVDIEKSHRIYEKIEELKKLKGGD